VDVSTIPKQRAESFSAAWLGAFLVAPWVGGNQIFAGFKARSIIF